jgi:hypothetical protein
MPNSTLRALALAAVGAIVSGTLAAQQPSALVCSGMLETEIDDVAGSFAPVGLREARRATEHEWGALLLRRGTGD